MLNKFAPLILVASTSAIETLEDGLYDIDFAYSTHLTKYGLSYDTVEEFAMRKWIFA